jgi:hypothetical protein
MLPRTSTVCTTISSTASRNRSRMSVLRGDSSLKLFSDQLSATRRRCGSGARRLGLEAAATLGGRRRVSDAREAICKTTDCIPDFHFSISRASACDDCGSDEGRTRRKQRPIFRGASSKISFFMSCISTSSGLISLLGIVGS